MKRLRLRGSGGASGVNGATLWTKGQQAAQERDQWDGRARSQRPAEPMAAARRLPGGPTSGWRRGQRTGARRKVRRLRGKMAAALALAAGLCVARRAVAVAGPRGAQVRSDRGSAEGVLRALPFSRPGVGVPSPGARDPAASRERSPDAGQGTAPLPWCKLRGCAVRSGWWAAVADARTSWGAEVAKGQWIGCCLISLPETQVTERLLRAASSAPPAGSEVCLLGARLLPLSGPWPPEHTY